MRQLLQHLGHQRRGDAIFLGNLIGTTSMLLAMHRQVLDGNQSVVGFFGKLEHRSRNLPDARQYATESVAHEVYSRSTQKSTQVLTRFKPNPCISTNL